MKIVIAGGSGLVGKALCHFFLNKGDEVLILTRKDLPHHSSPQYVKWLSHNSDPASILEGTDVFINLAGESIGGGRWNEKRKAKILQSRLNSTNELLTIISNLKIKPKVFINASAIGIYGTSLTDTFTEKSENVGNDFLANTVKQWESLARKASEIYGIRTVLCRFGIVLDKDGGALPKMSLPYRLRIGGKLGEGTQWVSWIHIEDVVKAISFVIKNEGIDGPVNFISPQPLHMDEFGKTLAKALHAPHWIPTPAFALKVLLGEMSMLMLEGQRVLPEKLLQHDYHFLYPTIDSALKNIFQK